MTDNRGTAPSPQWDALGFALRDTDVVYRALGDADRQPVWDSGEYLPYGPVQLNPASAFFSYGVGIFEGLKARRSRDGRVLMFRHRDNALRFQRSAERLLMPPFPEEQFVQAVEGVVRRNLRFVPPFGKGTFYVRPLQHAIEPKLGLARCSKFWVLVFGSPVGEYFAPQSDGGPGDGLRLRVLEQGRSAPGGTGAAKAMGNYAGPIALSHPWKERGFHDVLYLDARHVRYLTETTGSNVFVRMKNGNVATPPLDDQILPGITRDSAIRIARDMLGVTVEERPVPLDEVLSDGVEIFCTGTAWTVRSVRELEHGGETHRFESDDLQRQILDEIVAIQTGDKRERFGWITELEDE